MKQMRTIFALLLIASLLIPASVMANTPAAPVAQAPEAVVNFTILHNNDFHGNLQAAGSNPGMARLATIVNGIRAEVGEESVLLIDAGDHFQGSLLSNITQGVPTVDVYNLMGYASTTLGNHEFDWGQDVLADRTAQANYPFLAANIVLNDTGDCATAGWDFPAFSQPYHLAEVVATGGVTLTVGIIGVTSIETPYITISTATEGLCFRDPAESIIRIYDEVAAQADVIIAATHLGLEDGGYGYGLQVYGDKTLAARLNTAGKPVDMIIGGHSHTNMSAAFMVGDTAVVQAHYAGRRVGRADFAYDTVSGDATVTWTSVFVPLDTVPDPDVQALIDTYANDPDYLALVNTIVGFTNGDLIRNYNDEGTMGNFIQDAIYMDLNSDADPLNDADMVFNNPGGIRADIIATTTPFTLTYGSLYSVLPFGNQTVVGDMTGAQIVELLNQSATLFRGALQPGGIRYSFYRYGDGSTYWAWGAFDIEVLDKETQTWEPIDLDHTYRVATNEFLAPAGQDGFVPFKYMTNISYHGDMLDGVIRWVSENYTFENPYEAMMDGRIMRAGDNNGGDVIPVTILHNNDSHGYLDNWAKLATFIEARRAFNPERTLLLNAGDQIQGDSMSYYFRTAHTGFAADGTVLTGTLTTNPIIAVMNALGYDSMTVGNHEYNFGADVFKGVLGQAEFDVLQANVTDTGEYGIADVPVEPYMTYSLGMTNTIEVAVLGIGNHRVSNYELPSNIPGLSFSNPITTAQELAPMLQAENDLVIALTHIGFTGDPYSVEVDDNVDTVLAMETPGVDVIVGGHSHTNPKNGYGPYKWLPTIIGGVDNNPVIVGHAARRNTFLGEMVIGFLPDGEGGFEPVSSTGRYHEVVSATPIDPDIAALIQPYKDLLAAYNATELVDTITPIDAAQAYTQETNAANLQADAAVAELERNEIEVDFHLSGAMTNGLVASTATITNPVTLTVADMFSLMPYENSLLVMEMNGPQLKAVLERGYRNYYYYKYVDGRGGYSYYTTCMLATNAGNVITYNDSYPAMPNGDNVQSLVVGGMEIDLTDADTYYNVSTVNYLAAGSCNFNDEGVTLWPLDQVVADSQLYVRDAVINYLSGLEGPINPQVEGRLRFTSDFLTVSPSFLLGEPGDVVEFVLTLGNLGAETDTFAITSESMWDIDVMGEIGPIAAGELITFTASVTIPLTAEPGDRDTFVVTAVSQNNMTVTDSAVFEVIYPDTHGVLITADPIARTAYAGDEVQYEFTITNIGSITDTFSLALVVPAGVVTDFEEDAVTLGEGESISFTFWMTIPVDAAVDDIFAAVLTVTSLDNEGVTDTKTFTTTVIAQPVPEFLIYLPMVFKAPASE